MPRSDADIDYINKLRLEEGKPPLIKNRPASRRVMKGIRTPQLTPLEVRRNLEKLQRRGRL